MKFLIFILVVLMLVTSSFPSYADRVTKKSLTLFTFTGNLFPGLALAKNKSRKGLIISNNGADVILVQFGSSTGSSTYVPMRIPATTAVEFQNVPMDDIYIKGASSTGTREVGILEFE